MAIDLDNTNNCPTGDRCESCGVESTGLAVSTAHTKLGVFCVTLCERCGGSSVLPNVTLGTAMRFVGQHAAHLGVTIDEAAALDEEAGR